MKRVEFALLVAVLLCGSASGAMLSEGTREVSISGKLEQDETTVLTLALRGGYFFRYAVEGGGIFEIETAGSSYTQTRIGGFVEWNWDTELPVIPYAGTYAGIVHASVRGEGSDLAVECSGWAGAKCYLLENLAFGAQIQVWLATDDIYLTGSNDYGATEWSFILRTSFYF